MWDPSAVTSSNQLNWPNLAKKSNRIGLVPHGNSLAPDYLWPLNSRMGAWLWASSWQRVLTPGRTRRLQWVSCAPLCLRFCLCGKGLISWLYWTYSISQIQSPGLFFPAGSCLRRTMVLRKTDLHGDPGWLGFLFFYSNRPRTITIFSVLTFVSAS